MDTLGFFICNNISSASKSNFSCPFMNKCFLSLFSLIDLPRAYSTMLERRGGSENSCLGPYLQEKAFNLSPLNMLLAVHLSHMAFICGSMFFLHPICWEFLSWMEVAFCQIIFSSIAMIIFLSLMLLMLCITFIY